MKKSKYTEEQIAFALKQIELGTLVEEVCRKLGISDATFCNWRKKYGGLGPSELRRLRQGEEENSKLKRLVGGLVARQGDAAGRAIKNTLKPSRRRTPSACARKILGNRHAALRVLPFRGRGAWPRESAS